MLGGHGTYGMGMGFEKPEMGGHHACPVCGMMHCEGKHPMTSCPICGMGAGWAKEEGFGPRKLVKKAAKKLMVEKVKAKMDEHWGDKFEAVAEELVKLMEEKKKMKKELWQHKMEMKERLHELFAEEMEEEE